MIIIYFISPLPSSVPSLVLCSIFFVSSITFQANSLNQRTQHMTWQSGKPLLWKKVRTHRFGKMTWILVRFHSYASMHPQFLIPQPIAIQYLYYKMRWDQDPESRPGSLPPLLRFFSTSPKSYEPLLPLNPTFFSWHRIQNPCWSLSRAHVLGSLPPMLTSNLGSVLTARTINRRFFQTNFSDKN